MSDGTLGKVVTKLEAERHSVAGPSQERLDQLIAQLKLGITSPQDLDIYEKLNNEIQESITYFEVEHPKLTALLNELAQFLGSIGI